MASLIERMLKTSTIKQSALLSNSKVYGTKECIQTDVPMINVALSGSIDGGLLPGLLTLAGPSKHFKSGFALLLMAAFHRKYKDGIILFYDSEFGTPPAYFSTFGVDMDRVVHTPIVNVEELKFDVTKQLGEFTKSDKVMIVVDSVGNLASLKEAEDALDGKSVADMSRAKQLKSVFRIITPHLHLKDIPMVVINHTYMEMCMAEDTMIKTENSSVKISDIKIGDMVVAQNGLQRVLHVYGPNELSGEGKRFYELEFDDGSVVKCTHDHKFLMKNENWKEAADIKIGEEFY
jgi:RecA/RadA recombinase